MESYEEQQSNRLLALMPHVKDTDQLENIESNFKDVAHPNIGSRLGIRWIIYGYKNDAFPNLINSASFGLIPKSNWIKTRYADSIGQSIFHLLNEFEYQDSFNDVKLKLIANAYICFSGLIRGNGEQVYDSLNTRAKLIELISKEKMVKQFLNKYYYDGVDISTDMLTLSDRVLATIGYNKVGELENANRSLQAAKLSYQKILALPQYAYLSSLDIGDMTKISQENQEYLFQNVLKDFLEGKFEMSEIEFRQRIENERIKERKSFFGF